MLWQGGVVIDIVDHRGSIGLGVYRGEEGGETVNIKEKGEFNRECFPGSGPVSDRRLEGECSMFSMLGACDK